MLICVPDHWHARMSIDAMKAGKAVYCEKPMVRAVEEGPDVIAAQEQTGAVFQVGSQYASSILYDKVRDLIKDGAIGKLHAIEARYNRNSSIGAWQYSIPTDASPQTVDWDRFLGDAPKRPFDATRFFRWRNYRDYGTAVAGDLFVHLLTGIHHATGALGPTRIAAMGGLRYWKDGRDVYDVIMGLLDYPETDAHPGFTLSLQTDFEDGGGGGTMFRFVGTDGAISVSFTELTLSRVGIVQPTAEQVLRGYNSVRTFSKAQQAAFAERVPGGAPEDGGPVRPRRTRSGSRSPGATTSGSTTSSTSSRRSASASRRTRTRPSAIARRRRRCSATRATTRVDPSAGTRSGCSWCRDAAGDSCGRRPVAAERTGPERTWKPPGLAFRSSSDYARRMASEWKRGSRL